MEYISILTPRQQDSHPGATLGWQRARLHKLAPFNSTPTLFENTVVFSDKHNL